MRTKPVYVQLIVVGSCTRNVRLLLGTGSLAGV
jgi:hypothetical protein